MLWFTGSSREALPFIHDGFRPSPKPLHGKRRKSQHPPPPDNNDDNDSPSATARSLNHTDIGRDMLEVDTLRLPAVENSYVTNGPTSSRVTPRGDASKEPASFTSYMRRYKACARIKGFSPTRVFCATRMRPAATDNDYNHNNHPHLPHTTTTTTNHHDDNHQLSHHTTIIKDPFSTTSIPLSNLRIDPVSDPIRSDPPPSLDSTATELPELSTKEVTTVSPSSQEPPPSSRLEMQVEQKLRRGNSDDLVTTQVQKRGRGHRRRAGGGGGGTGGRGGGSGHVTGRGGAAGGGRPLGDIVSPQRMQELLTHKDERTLPYTYYRTAVGKDPAPSLENADLPSPREQ